MDIIILISLTSK